MFRFCGLFHILIMQKLNFYIYLILLCIIYNLIAYAVLLNLHTYE